MAKKPVTRQFVLPARCDRAVAEALLPEFIAATGSEPLEIDASATTQISQAMLQLLISARRSGSGAVILPSPTLMDVAQMAALSQELFDEAQP